jgi:hypothetical protein
LTAETPGETIAKLDPGKIGTLTARSGNDTVVRRRFTLPEVAGFSLWMS